MDQHTTSQEFSRSFSNGSLLSKLIIESEAELPGAAIDQFTNGVFGTLCTQVIPSVSALVTEPSETDRSSVNHTLAYGDEAVTVKLQVWLTANQPGLESELRHVLGHKLTCYHTMPELLQQCVEKVSRPFNLMDIVGDALFGGPLPNLDDVVARGKGFGGFDKLSDLGDTMGRSSDLIGPGLGFLGDLLGRHRPGGFGEDVDQP